MNKNEIIHALNTAHSSSRDSVKGLSVQEANRSAGGKWSVAQHVDHINKCLAPLVRYMCSPRDIIASKFGRSNRASVSYDDSMNRYHAAISGGGRVTTAAFAADEGGSLVPAVLTEDGHNSITMLCQCCETWTEAELDEYICPHPVFGKLTTREMLYFTIYHAQHHHNTVKRLLHDQPAFG